MWSAMKYALRIAQRLEYNRMTNLLKKENDWEKVMKGEQTMELGRAVIQGNRNGNGNALRRTGGNMRR